MEVSINGGTPSHHPFRTMGFSTINQPFWGFPMTSWKPPYSIHRITTLPRKPTPQILRRTRPVLSLLVAFGHLLFCNLLPWTTKTKGESFCGKKSGGFDMEKWWFHGDFMVISWWFHGDFMVISWWFHGDFMVISWWFHGDFMGIYMESMWMMYGISWWKWSM